MVSDLLALSPAERLLWDNGIRKPEHIDLEAIANNLGAHVVYRRLDGCVARLVTDGDSAVISISQDDNEGRQRFSLGHELAHLINDARKGLIRCASEDIGPQNAEAMSVEAHANSFASQLVLPDFLVKPWMTERKLTLNAAAQMAQDFRASVTASAIKLVKRSDCAVCVACHDMKRLRWFQKSLSWPFQLYVRRELHQDTSAFELAFGSKGGMANPRREQANRWITGPDMYRKMVDTQSMKLPDGSVLSMIVLGLGR